MANIMKGLVSEWWCYLTSFEGWGYGGIPQRPNSRATPQGLDQRLDLAEGVRLLAGAARRILLPFYPA